MTAAALIDTLHAAGFTLATDGARLTVSPAAKLTDTQREAIRAHRAEIVATLAAASGAEPTTHCPACGSPSWWLSPDGWCCAYCTPWSHPFLGASLVIAAAWADGRAPAPDEEPGHPAEPEPVRPDDGRVQDIAGAWRSPEHHAARAAFYAHHAACPTCRRAGQRRGLGRCDVGRALYSAYTLAALADRGGRP